MRPQSMALARVSTLAGSRLPLFALIGLGLVTATAQARLILLMVRIFVLYCVSTS